MGSAFIGYGILLAVALFVGSEWLKRVGHSQEWFDSWVIMLWGIVNTFTEVGALAYDKRLNYLCTICLSIAAH